MDPMGLNSSNLSEKKKSAATEGGEKGGARKGQLAGELDEANCRFQANGADGRLTFKRIWGFDSYKIGKNEGP